MKNQILPQLASHFECTGCLACVDACINHHAITYGLRDDGHWYPNVDTSKCIGCHLCERACPVVSKLPYSESNSSSYFAVWCRDMALRQKSATAGAFVAIATWTLDNGGIVVGAAVDGVCDVKHIVVDNKNELFRVQGSKYTQSNTYGIYSKVFELLKAGRLVLFSGTGCQVAGLYSYIGKRRHNGRLITVDLICGGVPSKHLINKFIENEPYKVKKVLSFRTKDSGWKPKGFQYNLKTEDENGIIYDYTNKRNLIIDGFCSEMTNRYSCYQCQFAGENRMSDYTIGDLWGTNEFPEQHYNGVSLLIAHSEDAILLLDEMKDYIEVHPTDRNKALDVNFRIAKTDSKRYFMPERMFMSWIMKNCSYSILKKIYASDYGNSSPWMLLKISQKILQKILK